MVASFQIILLRLSQALLLCDTYLSVEKVTLLVVRRHLMGLNVLYLVAFNHQFCLLFEPEVKPPMTINNTDGYDDDVGDDADVKGLTGKSSRC